MRRVASALVLFGGCKAPPEAPAELGELSRYLFRNQDAEDVEVLGAGLENLDAFLGDVDLVGDVNDRSWSLPDLQTEDVEMLERPDRDLSAIVGLSVSFGSVWAVEDHARVQSEADQTPFEPTAAEHYDRSFLNVEDSSCFVDRSCLVLETFSDATRNNILMEVTFELWKNFRWVEMEDGGWAFIARSWFKEPWPGARGNVTLQQSYAIDVWRGAPDGPCWRYQALWSESEGLPAGEDLVTATVKAATDGIFRAAEEQIGVRYYDGATAP